ncbi:MAG: uroporphyrinogen decarboxylase family protein [Armatimonadota bacterium]
MTRRERLIATLQGARVDRPAVSFYEIGEFCVNPADPDPFNIYNDPSWQPLLTLCEEKTDLIRMVSPVLKDSPGNRRDEFIHCTEYVENGSRFERTKINIAGRLLTSLTRRDPDVDTVWTLEHLLKDTGDLRAYLQLPDDVFAQYPDIINLIAEEEKLGDRGIVMVDTPDPLCLAAGLFSMEDYTIIALTEQELFHSLLEKLSRRLHATTEAVSEQFPGRLWRIFGPEYAAEPYLPPRLFKEYVVGYTQPMVESINKHGGFARIHCHGRIKNILPHIVEMGAAAIDPIEPPPQGDIMLSEIRREYGRDLVLLGNLEITDIENTEPAEFQKIVAKSLHDGTSGSGKGFVLMPSASPYGRCISSRTLANYETMVRLTIAQK